MPTLASLQRVLERHTAVDVVGALAKFRAQVGGDDVGWFIAYLVENGHLAPGAADAVHAALGADRHLPTLGARAPVDAVAPTIDALADTRVPDATLGASDTLHATGSDAPSGPREGSAFLRVQEVIGKGGMGTVFRAEQIELGRHVALKQLPDAQNVVLRERFLREARITAQLEHPNIVPVHVIEVSADGRDIGYAMKLVRGKTLHDLLQETASAYRKGSAIDADHALATRLDHFVKVCDAVAFAHARGILHRDLKPANFMIGAFHQVYVMDWGLARPLGDDADDAAIADGMAPTVDDRGDEPALTRVGDLIGTPHFSSPEQASGRHGEVDARSDQYSLGLVLFQVVSLRSAIVADSVEEAWRLASRGEKAPLLAPSRKERVPHELRAIVAKATAIAPSDRYPSVADFVEDVRRYLRGEAVVAKADTPLQALGRSMSRHRRTTLAAIALLVALAGATVAFTLYRKAESELAARKRGELKTQLYIDVAAQAYLIDAQLQRMEEGLEGLRVAAAWALAGAEPSEADAPVYTHLDFADVDRRPKDLVGVPDCHSDSCYRWDVSVAFPVAGLAPGVATSLVMPKLRRLSPLRRHMRAMFVTAGGSEPATMTDAQIDVFIRERRSPIDYAYVSLREGVQMMLPGMAALPKDYDVRLADFYIETKGTHGRRWQPPYFDATTDERGDDLVLPCTQAIWSDAGEFLGIAGVEVTVSKLVATGLALPSHTTLRTSLLDEKGRKIIDSTDAGRRASTDGKDKGLVLVDFDIAQVVAAVNRGEEGLVEVRRAGRDEIVVFARLDALGWFYVVEVDASSVEPR